MSLKPSPNSLRDEAVEQLVAELVAAPIGLVAAAVAGGDDHVEILLAHGVDEFADAGCVIGQVAIGEDVDVGIDVGEHAADDIALAGQTFEADDGAGGAGDVGGAVGRVVVVDVDGRVRQRGLERCDHARRSRRPR